MKGSNARALLVALCAGAAGAQVEAPDGAPPLPPQFEVEVIVFANRDFDPTEERFEPRLDDFGQEALSPLAAPPIFDTTTLPPARPAAPPVPTPLGPEPLAEPDPLAEARAAAEEALRIRPLAPSELKLGNEYRRLQALSAYEPLLHAGWVQPGLAEEDAAPFELATLGVLNPSGTVRVHLSRFLHITLDVTYRGAEDPHLASADDVLTEVALAPRYRLKTTRSVRSGELHYFDHPAFGILMRITPVPTPGTITGAGRRPAA
jgi:hypothetical protein